MTHPDDTSPQIETAATETADNETADTPDGLTILIRQALFLLEPFFLDGAAGNPAYARAAAKEILISYQIGSALELQLASESILFAYAAMETLRQAKVDPQMPDNRRLRLRSSAASLNRASHRNRCSLNALHKYRTAAPAPQETPFGPPMPILGSEFDPTGIMPDLLEKIAQHRERMAHARSAHAQTGQTPSPAVPPAMPAFMNRQQRRLAELTARREARRAQG